MLRSMSKKGDAAAREETADEAYVGGRQASSRTSDRQWAELGVPAAGLKRVRSCVLWGRSISRHWDAGGEGRAAGQDPGEGSAAAREDADAQSQDRERMGAIVRDMMGQWAKRGDVDELMPGAAVAAAAVAAGPEYACREARCELAEAPVLVMAGGQSPPASGQSSGANARADVCGQSPQAFARPAPASPGSALSDVCIAALGLSPGEAAQAPPPPG